jgi:hypothetical protein
MVGNGNPDRLASWLNGISPPPSAISSSRPNARSSDWTPVDMAQRLPSSA